MRQWKGHVGSKDSEIRVARGGRGDGWWCVAIDAQADGVWCETGWE